MNGSHFIPIFPISQPHSDVCSPSAAARAPLSPHIPAPAKKMFQNPISISFFFFQFEASRTSFFLPILIVPITSSPAINSFLHIQIEMKSCQNDIVSRRWSLPLLRPPPQLNLSLRQLHPLLRQLWFSLIARLCMYFFFMLRRPFLPKNLVSLIGFNIKLLTVSAGWMIIKNN